VYAAAPHDPAAGPISRPSTAALNAAGSRGRGAVAQVDPVRVHHQHRAEDLGRVRLDHRHHLGEHLAERPPARDHLEHGRLPGR
jgi:hypothetical protein